jgi:hypothetical protein
MNSFREIKVFKFEVICDGRFVFYDVDIRSRKEAEKWQVLLKERFQDEFGAHAKVKICEWNALEKIS